jgi:hypothetical protein
MMSKLSDTPDAELVSSLQNAFNEAIHAEKLFQEHLGMFVSVSLYYLFLFCLSWLHCTVDAYVFSASIAFIN